MFLAEKPANYWVCFNFSQRKISSTGHVSAAATCSRPTGQALSGPEWQQFLPLDDRDLALLR
jgi:hypothetical protein